MAAGKTPAPMIHIARRRRFLHRSFRRCGPLPEHWTTVRFDASPEPRSERSAIRLPQRKNGLERLD
jgi:hypothetical protein